MKVRIIIMVLLSILAGCIKCQSQGQQQKLLKIPRIYNALITSDEMLLPSQAYPAIAPIIRSIHYPLPGIYIINPYHHPPLLTNHYSSGSELLSDSLKPDPPIAGGYRYERPPGHLAFPTPQYNGPVDSSSGLQPPEQKYDYSTDSILNGELNPPDPVPHPERQYLTPDASNVQYSIAKQKSNIPPPARQYLPPQRPDEVENGGDGSLGSSVNLQKQQPNLYQTPEIQYQISNPYVQTRQDQTSNTNDLENPNSNLQQYRTPKLKISIDDGSSNFVKNVQNNENAQQTNFEYGVPNPSPQLEDNSNTIGGGEEESKSDNVEEDYRIESEIGTAVESNVIKNNRPSNPDIVDVPPPPLPIGDRRSKSKKKTPKEYPPPPGSFIL